MTARRHPWIQRGQSHASACNFLDALHLRPRLRIRLGVVRVRALSSGAALAFQPRGKVMRGLLFLAALTFIRSVDQEQER